MIDKAQKGVQYFHLARNSANARCF